MKRLKAGIIGLGVGERHIEGYERHPECEVAALCDFSDEKISLVGKKYPNIKITDNADEILKDSEIDIVSIASYDNYHYEQILKAIDNNKHIFVEKPLCLYEKEAIHIHSLLKSKPHLKISSNLILRKSPRFQSLKQMIGNGELGQLFYLEGDYNYGRLHKITNGWRGEIDFYSVVYGGGVHIVDLFLWLTGEDIDEVAAYGNSISSKGTRFRHNDMVVAIIKFKNGMVGKISVNFGCVMPHFHKFSVYGTKATFVNTPDYGMLFESRDPDAKYKKINTAYPGVDKGGLLYGFVDSILNNREKEVSKEDIFKSMSICFAIEKAARRSGPVKVNYI
jgi:predicted dehydrogenase